MFKIFSNIRFLVLVAILIPLLSLGQTNVSGNQSGIWNLAGSPYLIAGSVNVPVGQTLSIQPGVSIKMLNYNSYFSVYGTLIANGTATDSIRFFGTRNGPSNQYSHGGCINIEAGSTGSSIQYASLDSLAYPWNNNYDAAIRATGGLSFSNSTIKNSFNYGIKIERSNIVVSNGSFSATGNNSQSVYLVSDTISPTVQGCVFSGNTNARTIYATPGSITNLSNNTNAIIELSGTVTQNSSWQKPGPGSIYKANYIAVNSGKTLTIQPGCNILFPNYSSYFSINGTLIANGTATDSIRFYGTRNGPSGSYSHGGSINIEAGSTGSSIQYASLDSMAYPYSNFDAAIRTTGGLNLSNSIIKNSYQRGLTIQRSNAVVNNCSFIGANNTAQSIYLVSDTISPTVQGCVFSGNTNARTIYATPGTITNLSNNTNAIIELSGSVTQNSSWQKPGPGSIYKANYIAVNSGKTLTIQPGCNVLLPEYYSYFTISGTLIANGTATDSIRFYGTRNGPSGSYSHGGSINIEAGSTGSSIQYASLDSMAYPYSNFDAAIRTTGGLNLSNSIIKNSYQRGLTIQRSNAVVNNCSFIGANNTAQSIYLVSDTISPTVQGCVFSGNTNARTIYATPGTITNLSNNTNAVIELSGNITQNSSWQKPGPGSIYKANYIAVNSGKTLTIQPGCNIQLPGYSSYFSVSGTLIANGTATDSIRFYGIRNGSSGEYTHGGSINIEAGSIGSSIQYASLDSMAYPWSANFYSAIRATGGLSLSNSTIKNSYYNGLRIERSNVTVNNCNFNGLNNNERSILIVSDTISPTVQGCVFSGNTNARNIYATPGTITNLSNNTNAVIELSGNITQNSTWQKPGPGSIYKANFIAVNSGKTLTIQPGCSIQFPGYSSYFSVSGTLIANGTATDSIRFYGIRNGSSGEYTHGGSINIEAGSIGSSIQYASLDSMAYPWSANFYAAIRATGGLSLSNSTIKNSYYNGLRIERSNVTVNNCNFNGLNNNERSILIVSDTISPTVQGCVFSGNTNARTIYSTPGTITNLSNNTNAIIELSGNITQNSTWQKPGPGSIYKANYIAVNSGKTLTIQPGCNIQLPGYSSYFSVSGTLIANGTATDSIRFYGIRNGSSGEYTHGGSINIEAGSTGSSISYASLDSMAYPWSANFYAAIRATGGLSLSNSTIKNSYYNGLRIERSNVTVSNCNFNGLNNNERSILIVSDTLPTIQNCNFSGNNFAKTINGSLTSFINLQNNNNAILQIANSSISSNATLTYPGTNSYYQLQSNLSVAANIILTINPSILLDFSTTTAGISVAGSLRALGSESSPVQFTRVNSSGTTSANFGGTITFNANSTAILSNLNISRLGSGSSALTINSNVTTQINNLNVSGNFNRGITISGSSPNIATSVISGNQTGVFVMSGKPIFSSCNILSNTSFGINTLPSAGIDTIDARSCWWGDITGPRQTTTNPSGLGNQVSLRVKYNPWLGQPTGNLVNDIGIAVLDSPKSNCNLLINELVKVKISNFGNVPQTGFNVGYKINDASPVIENVGALIVPPGGTISYSFATRANLSTANTLYTIKSFTNLVSDTLKLNDTIANVVEHYPQLLPANNLIPLNNATDINKPVNFSWSSVTGALSYDLFVWLNGAAVPTTATVAGITQINYSYNNASLLYGSTYKWKVKATRNNCNTESAIQTFTIRNLPDLIIQDITVPPAAVTGTSISFSWKIKNQGIGNTGSTQWIDRVYLSDAPQLNIGTDYLVGSYQNFSALTADQTYQTPIYTYTIPAGLQGNYYLIVSTDTTKTVIESNEQNNRLTSSVMAITLAPPPDLQVQNLIVSPSTAFSEDTLTVKWMVKNNGIGPTTVTQWTDAVYLSGNAVFNQVGATLLLTRNHNGALAVNASYNDSVRVKLPINSQGTYFIHVLTDLNNTVAENTNENNNTATSQSLNIILRPTPNLVVTNITIPPDTLSVGQQVNLQWTNKNEGAVATTTSFRDDVYISADNVFSATQDQIIASFTRSGNLASLATMLAQASLQMPSSLAQGNYYFFVKTDAGNTINEFPNENDNVSTAAGPVVVALPDLVAGNLQIPATTLSELNISVNYTATNIGLGSILLGSWTDRVYLSTDNVFGGGDVLLGSVANNNILLRNSSYSRQVSVSIPPAISGNYFIIVISNAGATINESNNNNNTVFAPITISLAPWPDLVVTSVNAPANNTAGLAIAVSYTGKNNGAGGIVNKQWRDDIFLSPTNSLSDPNNRLLGSVNQNRSLSPAETYSSAGTFTIPSNVIPGTYYIVSSIDAGNAVFENNLDNNNRSISSAIAVAALPNVDLAVTIAALNTNTITAGQSVQANYTVKNAGLTTALPGGWTDAIYLSNNTVIDANDRLLGNWQVNSLLAPNATLSHNRTVTIPADANGTLYLLVLTDVNNTQNDINRGNNYLTLNTGAAGTGGGIVIIQPSPVDLQPISLIVPTEVSAGQPFSANFIIRNNGPGASFANGWIDNVYMATSANATSATPLKSISFTGSVAATAVYYDSTEFFVPNNFSGNYVVAVRTNANNAQYELNGSNNNIISSPIVVTPQQPCDLAVNAITTPSTIQIAGQFINLEWIIKNQGLNTANGYFRDAVYLSADTLFDATDDILLGTVNGTNNIIPGQTISRQLTATLNNVVMGNYYVIVRTDILNNLLELNENNNTGTSASPIIIEVKPLQIAVTANDTLFNGRALYYRISISSAQANETMSLKFFGDSVTNSVNRLYLKYGQVPVGNSYDFVAEIPFKANQEVIVPTLQAGTYYIMAVGNDTSALQKQAVQLLANIIPFSVTGVNSNKGGNTGSVTIKINGAKFNPSTKFILRKASVGNILSISKYYVDASTVFVTYNLLSKAIGFYDVVAVNQNNDSARLVNSFEIVNGPGSSSGSGSGGTSAGPGFTCQEVNIGFEELIQTDLLYAQSTRFNRVETIIIAYENKGTVDIPLPTRFILSLTGVPLGFTIPELESNKTVLPLSFAEVGGPPGILRAGAKGFIKVFTKASLRIPELQFVITE